MCHFVISSLSLLWFGVKWSIKLFTIDATESYKVAITITELCRFAYKSLFPA